MTTRIVQKCMAGLARLLVLMGICFAAPIHAETNLLINPVLAPGGGANSLPTGWVHQGWVPDGSVSHQMGPCPNAYLCSGYSYGVDVDGKPYMDVSLNNTSGWYAYTNLFFNQPVAASAADSYRLTLTAKIVATNMPVSVGLGFHLYDAAGYLSESATDYSQQLNGGAGDQSLLHHFQTGVPYANTGRTPTQIQPRLNIYLAPGAQLQIRIKSPWLGNAIHLASVGVDMRTGLPQRISAAPGKVFKFTAGLQGRPASLAKAYVTLVSTTGVTRNLDHPVSVVDPNVGDVWQVLLPTSMPAGDYSIRYLLRDAASGRAVALQPDADVLILTGRIGTSYEIGRLDVSASAGMSIGQHFHGHPGRIGGSSRGTDPILVPYHFVRSHDSDNVGGTSWWIEDTATHSPDGKFDWTEFDRWANFHAASGQKKLLVTFYGSPTWASSKPNEASPYGTLGLSAPPQNMASYQRMVQATVSRYRDRMFATECWNEPGPVPGGYYTGTGTQLADICKAIYVSTKAVDPSIPVICPSADLGWVLTQTTSQGEPLHQFCDWVNGHPYNSTGADLAGADYSIDKLGAFVESMESNLKQLGLNKPIALTEWGMSCDDRPAPAHPTHFHSMASQSRGDLLYQMLAKAKEKGVVALGLYSYDSGTAGYFNGTTGSCPYGWEGIGSVDVNGQYSYDATTAQGVTQAVRDFGRPLP